MADADDYTGGSGSDSDDGSAVDEWSQFCGIVDALDDEQCLTWYCRTYSLMLMLQHTLKMATREPLRAARAAKLALLQALAEDRVPPCVRVRPDVFVRLAFRQVTGRDINIATLAESLQKLDVAAASTALIAQQHAQFAKWAAKHTKKPAATRKNARPSLKRKAVDAADGAAAAAAPQDVPLPPEPEVKYIGKNKVPTRKDLPMHRPLTMRELLAQLAYNSAHGFHKPRKAGVSVLKRVPAASGAVDLAALDDAAQTVVHEFLRTQAALKAHREATANERQRRLKMAKAKQYLDARLLAYIKRAGGKQSRTVPLDEGDRTFTLQVFERTVAARTLTLWDTSQLIDALVAERFPECEWNAAACPVAFDEGFIAELQLRVQATLDARTRKVEAMRVYRSRVHEGTRKAGVPVDDEDDDGAAGEWDPAAETTDDATDDVAAETTDAVVESEAADDDVDDALAAALAKKLDTPAVLPPDVDDI